MRNSLIAALLVLTAVGCGRAPRPVANGDPHRGQAAIFKYGCGSCHTISGMRDAHGLVGPPLTGIRDRMYVAGMLQNDPDNLIHWISDPKSVNSKTAMPNLGVSSQEARDIAAYLYAVD